jgi:MSHA biogenesis protein MshK
VFKWVLLATFLVSQTALALVDPTQPSSYRAPAASVSHFKLSSILVSGQRKVAVINGRALSVGESVGEARVVKIEKQQVLLNSSGKMIKLVPARTTVKRER